jgi:hypothetical protein
MSLCNYGCGQEGIYQLKNGKWCCSKSWNSCPEIRKKNSSALKLASHYTRFNPNKIIVICNFCKKQITLPSKKLHELGCYLNPKNLRLCFVCQKPIKNYKSSKTCSHTCANRYFKQREIEDENSNEYRKICFKYHKKECIICNEVNIVHAHHFDVNRKNNNPSNLLPLCPTHHKYMHSRFRELIISRVETYINEWKKLNPELK